MYKLKEEFFDFEVFPNWWCVVLGKYPQDEVITEKLKNDFLVITSDMPDAREVLLKEVNNKEYAFFGYNNKHYDNIILNGVASGFNPRQLKILNDIMMNPEAAYLSAEHMRISPFARKKYNNFIYQDLYDDNTGSLKEKECCLQLDIRESSVPFDKENLTEEDKAEIISYCKHDVWSTMQFYKKITKIYVDSKLTLCKVFNLPIETAYKATNATLVGKILGAVKTSYPDALQLKITLPKQIEEYIKYSLPKAIIDHVTNSPKKLTVNLFKNIVDYANGGIHSIPCNNLQVKANDKMTLMNIDASSFYPAIMINFNLLSRSAKKKDLFTEIYKTRIAVKNGETDKIPEEFKTLIDQGYISEKDLIGAFKLVMNTTYGASGNKYLDLYDPFMTTNVCRVGQLLLTALANNLYNGVKGLQVVQTNTDGVLVYYPRSEEYMVKQICDAFTDITNILLEMEPEQMIWQRDVNNYVMYDQKGVEKPKGSQFVSVICQKGRYKIHPLDAFVSREAVKSYLSTGEDIVEHIYKERDLSKFVVTCHKGSFSSMVRQFNDGRPDEPLYKTNRVYASLNKNLGMLMKIKKFKGQNKKYKSPGCPEHCELINDDLSKYNVDDIKLDIDYMWYIEEAYKLLTDEWYEMTENGINKINLINE